MGQDLLRLVDLPERIELGSADRAGGKMALHPLLLRQKKMPLEVSGKQAPRMFTFLLH
jgi:hypothetical protein